MMVKTLILKPSLLEKYYVMHTISELETKTGFFRHLEIMDAEAWFIELAHSVYQDFEKSISDFSLIERDFFLIRQSQKFTTRADYLNDFFKVVFFLSRAQ